jgi:predicted transcriptional regulator
MKYTRSKIRNKKTGQEYASAATLAHTLGVTRAQVSNHLAGRAATLCGQEYERIGAYNRARELARIIETSPDIDTARILAGLLPE